jgi:hypothetical protein
LFGTLGSGATLKVSPADAPDVQIVNWRELLVYAKINHNQETKNEHKQKDRKIGRVLLSDVHGNYDH